MKWNDFEKHVASSLKNQEIPLDTNALVSRIFQPEKKKRRVFPFFWLVFGLFLAIGLGVVILHDNKTVTEVKKVMKDIQQNATYVHQQTTPSIVSQQSEIVKSMVTDNFIKNNNLQLAAVKKGTDITGNKYLSRKKTDEATLIVAAFHEEDAMMNLNTNSNSPVDQLPFLGTTWRKVETPTTILFPKRNTVECPSFSLKKKLTFFCMPEFGMSLPLKTLQERMPDISEVAAFRKENEKSLEGIHGGLYAGLYIGKSPFYIKTGLTYSRLTERLDLSYHYTKSDTTQGIISITKSQSGDTITIIYGDIVTESTIRGQKIKHHYFHLIDLPVCLGYQYNLTSRWTMGVEAGVNINLGLRTEGQVLSSLHDFKPVEKSQYQRTLGLGYRFGLDVEYALSSKVGAGLQARVNGYPRSFTSPHSNYKQNYMIPGAHLYLKYYFTN